MPLLPHDEGWELCLENAHPDARALLTEAWYWDCTDDYSPFGNDTGADTLCFYSKQLLQEPTLTGPEFLAVLLAGWEMNPRWEAASNEAVEAVLANDRHGIETTNDAAIAVAFAQILLFGRVESASRDQALLAISRSSLPCLLALGTAPGRRVERLKVMRDHLQKARVR